MTSILTNTPAMAALQTLRAVKSQLNETQGQVSSGLRVETASDNAAYWSIATTMRSDNKAISAVADALGLGAAKIDTASAGLTATIDIVSEFKAKLVASTETGVDRTKIQDELQQLKAQLVSIATSASFNGVNWLNTSAADNLVEISTMPVYITSSFVRSEDGAISIGQTAIEGADISLFNVGGGGALQKDIRSLGDIGGLRNADLSNNSFPGNQAWAITSPVTLSGTDTIAFDIAIDDNSATHIVIGKATIDAALGTANGVIANDQQYAAVLNRALADADLSSLAWVNSGVLGPNAHTINIISQEQTGNDASSIMITNVVQLPSGNAGGFGGAPIVLDMGSYKTSVPGDYASSSFPFTAPFRVYRDVSFSFDIAINGEAPRPVTVDRDMVDSVLGTTDGWINSVADFAAVLSVATAGTGLLVSESGGQIRFDVDTGLYPEMGRRSQLVFGKVTDSLGPVPDFDILDVDVTDPTKDLADYLTGVEAMLSKVITAGAALGSAKTRIDMQADFADGLMDSVDKGIGRLVDTDMEAASARLTALQTQQQLAVQGLQIANSSAQTILSLFTYAGKS